MDRWTRFSETRVWRRSGKAKVQVWSLSASRLAAQVFAQYFALRSFMNYVPGLNLTCCNNVILVDLWWNPALEVSALFWCFIRAVINITFQDQAFDRAHRFGQKRAVNIHKLCVPNTVEQRILEVTIIKLYCFPYLKLWFLLVASREEARSRCRSFVWRQTQEYAPRNWWARCSVQWR